MVEIVIALFSVAIGVALDRVWISYQEHKLQMLKDEKKRSAAGKTAAKRRAKALKDAGFAGVVGDAESGMKAAQNLGMDGIARSGPGPTDQADPQFYGRRANGEATWGS